MKEEVKRYGMCGFGSGIVEMENGPCVAWDDYEALLAELVELRKDAQRYRFLCDPEDADEDYLAHAVNTLNAWADKSEIDQAVDDAMATKRGVIVSPKHSS